MVSVEEEAERLDHTPRAPLREGADTLAGCLAEPELGRWTAIHDAVRPDDPATPGMMIDGAIEVKLMVEPGQIRLRAALSGGS